MHEFFEDTIVQYYNWLHSIAKSTYSRQAGHWDQVTKRKFALVKQFYIVINTGLLEIGLMGVSGEMTKSDKYGTQDSRTFWQKKW